MMMDWIIAHNLGIVLMAIPCALVARLIMAVEDYFK